MFEISKIYIRSLTAITGIVAVLLYAIHTGNSDTDIILGGFASVIACVLLDKEKTEE